MKNKTIILESKKILIQLADSINTLNLDDYIQKIELLSNGTIGEHTRHIIELFQQLIQGYEAGNIDYDNRKRNLDIQQNIDFAVESIANIICELDKKNKALTLTHELNDSKCLIETNYYRELMYNLEHCIHHQAIIKIAFCVLGKNDLAEDFGVAKSTMKFRKQCAH